MEFIAFIFGIILIWFMGYLIYNHFATPFKIINETNKEKEMAKLISEKCKVVLEDNIFQERIAPIKTALENNEITNEKFQEIFVELFKERTKEIFNNGNHTDVND